MAVMALDDGSGRRIFTPVRLFRDNILMRYYSAVFRNLARIFAKALQCNFGSRKVFNKPHELNEQTAKI